MVGMQNCSNDNLDDYNVFLSSQLHYPDDCNNNQKDSCVGDSGSGLMREIEMAGDHFARYSFLFFFSLVTTFQGIFFSCFG